MTSSGFRADGAGRAAEAAWAGEAVAIAKQRLLRKRLRKTENNPESCSGELLNENVTRQPA